MNPNPFPFLITRFSCDATPLGPTQDGDSLQRHSQPPSRERVTCVFRFTQGCHDVTNNDNKLSTIASLASVCQSTGPCGETNSKNAPTCTLTRKAIHLCDQLYTNGFLVLHLHSQSFFSKFFELSKSKDKLWASSPSSSKGYLVRFTTYSGSCSLIQAKQLST